MSRETFTRFVCDRCGEDCHLRGNDWLEVKYAVHDKSEFDLCPGCCASFQDWLRM